MLKKGLLFLFINLSLSSISQERFSINAGVGFPELLNIGVRYQIKQFQIGSSIGSYSKPDTKYLSVSGDVFIHGGKTSIHSDLKLWYMRLGYNYTKKETNESIFEFGYINWRVGRDMYLWKNFGMNLELLVAFRVYDHEIVKIYDPCYSFCDFKFGFNGDVYPGLGFTVFYKI